MMFPTSRLTHVYHILKCFIPVVPHQFANNHIYQQSFCHQHFFFISQFFSSYYETRRYKIISCKDSSMVENMLSVDTGHWKLLLEMLNKHFHIQILTSLPLYMFLFKKQHIFILHIGLRLCGMYHARACEGVVKT